MGWSKAVERCFNRFYHLESNKEVLVCNKREWDKGVWKWKWEWLRDSSGRATGEVDELQNFTLDFLCLMIVGIHRAGASVEQVSAKEGKCVRVESVIGEASGSGRVR
ncbi:hypothetical protein Tco_1060767 [Tanacetum coccineum]